MDLKLNYDVSYETDKIGPTTNPLTDIEDEMTREKLPFLYDVAMTMRDGAKPEVHSASGLVARAGGSDGHVEPAASSVWASRILAEGGKRDHLSCVGCVCGGSVLVRYRRRRARRRPRRSTSRFRPRRPRPCPGQPRGGDTARSAEPSRHKSERVALILIRPSAGGRSIEPRDHDSLPRVHANTGK